MTAPIDPRVEADQDRKPLTAWRCAKCGGTLASVWIAKFADDAWLDSALGIHEMSCDGLTGKKRHALEGLE